MAVKAGKKHDIALKRFRLAVEGSRRWREKAVEDNRFAAGEQWPEEIRQAREADGKPCLTVNRMPVFLRQITNEQRRNRPQINTVGFEDSDVEAAEIMQGMIRNIEGNSLAKAAYAMAGQHAATFGVGYVRVLADYEGPDAVDEQELRIDRILNPFSVYIDPGAKKPDASDMRFAFIVEDMDEASFREEFPGKEPMGAEQFREQGDSMADWAAPDGHVRVAEYYYIEYETTTNVKLADGRRMRLEEVPEGAVVIARREGAKRPVVKWCKLSATEVLEEGVWVGSSIPIVPVYGDEVVVDGERDYIGAVRHTRDQQRRYNYMVSAETQTIALAPQAPFIVPFGALEGFEADWAVANTKNHAFLYYNAIVEGNPIPPPARQVAEPPIAAIVAGIQQADNDLKSTYGIYDASLGERGAEQSGKAIMARQRESDTSNFHYIDNLARAIERVGRILVEAIPKVYDTERIVRITQPDGTSKSVKINGPITDGQGSPIDKIYNVADLKADVVVSTGPSYETQRQENVASMLDLVKAIPPVGMAAPDLIVGQMDFPASKEIAKRVAKALPPGLQDQPEGQPEVPPALAQQMQALQQQHEQLTQIVQQQAEEIKIQKAKADSSERIAMAEIASRERMKEAELEVKRLEILSKINTDEAEIELEAAKTMLTTIGQTRQQDAAEAQYVNGAVDNDAE